MMFVRGFFEASTYISLIGILIPFIWIGGHVFQVEHVFSALIISYVYRLHGVIFFSNGITLYTQGRVVMRRIKNLLITNDLEDLEEYMTERNSKENNELNEKKYEVK